MIPSEPDDRDTLAGEYVLGLLSPEAVAEVERALAEDPDLARRVADWEERLLPAAATLRPEVIDPALWPRIERALTARRARAAPAPAWTRAWRSTSLWQATTALATAAALALAILPQRPWTPSEGRTRFFAILQARDAAGRETGPGWLIQIATDGTVRSLPLTDVQPGSGRSLQLWTLWDAARGPVSLGVLPPGGAVRLPSDRLAAIGDDQLFEITLEPEAGSPTGRPTGRILFIGRARSSNTQSL